MSATVTDLRPRLRGAATVVVVAYRIASLELGWLDPRVPVVVVHNDDTLDRDRLGNDRLQAVTHLEPGRNIGFGAAVNLALRHIDTTRTILVNPDTALEAEHYAALATAADNEVVTVPLRDAEGRYGGAANPYPTALTATLSAYRVGRWFRADGRIRRMLGRGSLAIGQYDTTGAVRSWPLAERWPSGAVVSYPTAALRAVGGFDERFFLYVEDLDLAARLSQRFPDMVLRVASTGPAFHAVGATSHGEAHGAAAQHRVRSWHTYAADRSGWRWTLACALIAHRTRPVVANEASR
jgi:GT2 family glycosyltransferase